MRKIREIWRQIVGLLTGWQQEREMQEEMQHHIDLEIEKNVLAGMSEKEARSAAHRRFGNLGGIQLDARENRTIFWIEQLFRDVHFGLRYLRRNLPTSVMAILVIATGIGVSIAIFAALRGIAFSDLRGPHAGRIVHLGWRGSGDVSAHDYRTLQDAVAGLEAIAAFSAGEFTFRRSESEGSARRYSGGRASSEFFAVPGESAIRGRTFAAMDLSAGPQVVVSHRVWQEQFGGDDAAVGSSVWINGTAHTLVGVMPPGFGFPESHGLWIKDDRLAGDASPVAEASRVIAFGLLKDNVSMEQVQSQIDAVADDLGAEFSPGMRERSDMRVSRLQDAFANDQVENFLKLLMGMAVLVLLAAGINVGNIVIALTAKRSLELTVRSALGATRRHIMAQVLVFGFLLAAAGGALGIGLAVWGTDLMWQHINTSPDLEVPYWWHMNIDGPVVLFVAATLLLIILGSSFLPAVRAARADNFALLKDSTRTSSGVFIGRLSRFLVGAQVCVSVALGLCALVVMHEVRRKVTVELPFPAENTLTARLPLDRDAGITDDRMTAFLDTLRQDMEMIPGVEAVGFSSSQAGLLVTRRGFAIDGGEPASPDLRPRASVHALSQEAFNVLRLVRLSGRLFTNFDAPEAPKVAVVNRIFAARFLGGQNPVGTGLRIDGHDEPLIIVGVVSDLLVLPQNSVGFFITSP